MDDRHRHERVRLHLPPNRLAINKGEPVTLVFPLRTASRKDVIIYLDDDKTTSQKLPFNLPIE